MIYRILLLAIIVLSSCTSQVSQDPRHDASNHSDIENRPIVLWTANAVLRGDIGNGFAEVRYNDDRSMNLFVRANLFPTDLYYVAWIINTDNGEMLNVGTLDADNNEGSYSLNISAHLDDVIHSGDMRNFTTLSISEEVSADLNSPSTRVLKGTFIQVASTGIRIDAYDEDVPEE